jgi:hypothetical protein
MTRTSIILGLLFFGLTIKTLFACSCLGESNVQSGLASSAIVVSGQIISTSLEWLPDSTTIKMMAAPGKHVEEVDKRMYGTYLKKVLVKVETIFKGNTTNDTLIIYTGLGHGDCGYNFETGQKYIIYGARESYFSSFFDDLNFPTGPNIFWTDICTRTKELDMTEIIELEKIRK